jgi:hypothetical protein
MARSFGTPRTTGDGRGRYDALGEAAVEPLFGDPHTHTSRAGAELNAECVVAGLKALPHDPVARYFSAKGKAVAAYAG